MVWWQLLLTAKCGRKDVAGRGLHGGGAEFNGFYLPELAERLGDGGTAVVAVAAVAAAAAPKQCSPDVGYGRIIRGRTVRKRRKAIAV